ncbi:unnamed protein product [Nyctereutes procyonoides]|uniref:(raccoon dog) hypothetical protein n=1 Tax=Nyctereutes procyonoides TaxID=34880 RepID=A0A811YFJ9_NYCPR|nr:unnamed protein product [Nyctereutes procyonoides]
MAAYKWRGAEGTSADHWRFSACLWPRVRSWSPGIESCEGSQAPKLLTSQDCCRISGTAGADLLLGAGFWQSLAFPGFQMYHPNLCLHLHMRVFPCVYLCVQISFFE